MARLDELALAVRRHWLSEGVFDRELTGTDVNELEERVGNLSSAYKSFLLIGGAQADSDEEGFFFWPPAEIRPVNEVLADAHCSLATNDSAIVIADYLQESWFYGLWISGVRAGEVFLVLGFKNEQPRDSIGRLEDFLSAYLSRSVALYPPDDE